MYTFRHKKNTYTAK